MGYQNIRGLEANLDLFEEFLRSHDELDIIALSETHIRNNTITNHLNIERYFFVGRNRSVWNLLSIQCGSRGEAHAAKSLQCSVNSVSYTHLRAHETPEPSRMPSSA